jgi:hypothetical protein
MDPVPLSKTMGWFKRIDPPSPAPVAPSPPASTALMFGFIVLCPRQSGLEGKEFGISRVRMHHTRAAMMNDDDHDNEHRKPETAVRTSELINMMRYTSIRLSFDCF